MPKILSGVLLLFFAAALGLRAPIAWADDAKVPVLTTNDRVLGNAKAPITIFEYASLTCPHCAAFEREKLPEIRKEWVDTGKAKLVFRDFPLDGNAVVASAIARCAPPDRYFAFVGSLFESQVRWVLAQDPVEALKKVVRLGGMDGATVDKCRNDAKLQDAIFASEVQGKNDYGVESTPTFFIVGPDGVSTKLIGDLPYDDFARALSAAMPKS